MPRVVHFEIYTDDPEAVRPFYQDVFGWKFEKFEVRPNQLIFIIRNREQNHIAYSFARRIRPRTLEQRNRLN